MSSNELSETKILLKNHFIEEIDDQLSDVFNFEGLVEKMSRVIDYYLNYKFDRLIQIFYKIDLDEGLFKHIISTAGPGEISSELAKAVIDREIKKVYYRMKYKNLG